MPWEYCQENRDVPVCGWKGVHSGTYQVVVLMAFKYALKFGIAFKISLFSSRLSVLIHSLNNQPLLSCV